MAELKTCPFLVINLDRSPERLDAIRAQLEPQGLVVERVPAVDARLISEDERRALGCYRFSPDGGMPLSVVDAAICLSHFKALTRFLESDAPFAVVLEDDARITPLALSVVAEVLRDPHRLPDFDGLELSGWGRSEMPILPVMQCGPVTIGKARKSTPGAAMTLYSRQGAAKILRKAHPLRSHWDNYLSLSWLHGARLYTARPFPASQDSGFASTNVEVTNAPQIRKRPLDQWLRRARYRIHQGPRKFLSDLIWMGLPAMMNWPGSTVSVATDLHPDHASVEASGEPVPTSR